MTDQIECRECQGHGFQLANLPYNHGQADGVYPVGLWKERIKTLKTDIAIIASYTVMGAVPLLDSQIATARASADTYLRDCAPCTHCNGDGWREPTQDEADELAEATYDRSLECEPPMSMQERHERDWKQKQELRR